VAAAARQTGHLLQTFTVTQPGSKLDESRHAKLVSAHFGTTHHELSILDSGLAVLDELAPFIDEPLADSSLIPTYLISQLTRKHVTVALSGDGGDELFGGYAHYSTNLLDEKRLDWAPIQLLQIVGAAASRLPAGFKGRNRIAALQSGPSLQRAMGSNFFDVQLRRKILTESAIAELGIEMGAPENGLVESLQVGSDSVDRMTRTDFHTVLADGYLVKVDRASMAVSLEMRSPFLDHRLVEFSFGRIPSKWKVLGAETRRLERVIARRWLPPTLDMKRKQGFSISMEAWLRKVPRTWHESWLDRLPSQINRDFAFKLVKGLHSGRSNGSRIFALAMLSLSNARLNKE
jgi:asparagine synthase (glutamine-hydrolysing)